jgi:hypothetical protein
LLKNNEIVLKASELVAGILNQEINTKELIHLVLKAPEWVAGILNQEINTKELIHLVLKAPVWVAGGHLPIR